MKPVKDWVLRASDLVFVLSLIHVGIIFVIVGYIFALIISFTGLPISSIVILGFIMCNFTDPPIALFFINLTIEGGKKRVNVSPKFPYK